VPIFGDFRVQDCSIKIRTAEAMNKSEYDDKASLQSKTFCREEAVLRDELVSFRFDLI
jgi:hypothetical protein